MGSQKGAIVRFVLDSKLYKLDKDLKIDLFNGAVSLDYTQGKLIVFRQHNTDSKNILLTSGGSTKDVISLHHGEMFGYSLEMKTEYRVSHNYLRELHPHDKLARFQKQSDKSYKLMPYITMNEASKKIVCDMKETTQMFCLDMAAIKKFLPNTNKTEVEVTVGFKFFSEISSELEFVDPKHKESLVETTDAEQDQRKQDVMEEELAKCPDLNIKMVKHLESNSLDKNTFGNFTNELKEIYVCAPELSTQMEWEILKILRNIYIEYWCTVFNIPHKDLATVVKETNDSIKNALSLCKNVGQNQDYFNEIVVVYSVVEKLMEIASKNDKFKKTIFLAESDPACTLKFSECQNALTAFRKTLCDNSGDSAVYDVLTKLTKEFNANYSKYSGDDSVTDSIIAEMEQKFKEIKGTANKLTNDVLKSALVKESEDLLAAVKKQQEGKIDAFVTKIVEYLARVNAALSEEKKDDEVLKTLVEEGEKYQEELKSYQGKLSPEQKDKIKDLDTQLTKLKEVAPGKMSKTTIGLIIMGVVLVILAAIGGGLCYYNFYVLRRNSEEEVELQEEEKV